MPKKLFVFIMILAILFPIYSSNAQQPKQVELITSEVRLGHWDIWLHADGKTWQHTGKPGDYKEYTFEMTPPAEAKDYDNVYFVAKAGVTQEQYEAVGGRHGMAWEDFYEHNLRFKPADQKLVNNSPKVGFTLNEPSENIKKEWQSQEVRGQRWYLPIYVEWYGTPKEPEKEPIPEPEPPPPPTYNPPASSPIDLRCIDMAYYRNISGGSSVGGAKGNLPWGPRPSKDTSSWQTRYSWVSGVSYDEDGNSYERWSSRTVTYSEKLEFLSIDIDSWQSTPDKGRGAWEIMPLFGNQAHRTIRAGTGFEVKVVTRYWTDWETKVPVQRDYYGRPVAIGGTYLGPERVSICFPYYNYATSVHPQNNKDFIRGRIGMGYGVRVELEPTNIRKVSDQEWIITWEIPEHSYTGESGRTYRARTHIVDKFFPDIYPDSYVKKIKDYFTANSAKYEGKVVWDDRYRFYIAAQRAGKNGLYAIAEDYVYVFGHIFRDIYTTRPPDNYY